MDNDKLTPRQASDFLGIGTETLKKYASLLEHNGHFIGRNARQHRYYTGTDIGLLRAMITLNRDKSVTLEDAASIVTSADADIKEILNETGATVTDTVDSTEVSTVIPLQFQEITGLITVITNSINELHKDNEILQQALTLSEQSRVEFQREVLEKMNNQTKQIEQLQKELEASKEMQPSSFWGRLFNRG